MTPKPIPIDPARDAFLAQQQAAAAAPQEQTVDWAHYLNAIRRRIWLVIGVIFVACIGAAAYTARQPKAYKAAASIVIETSTPRVLTGVENVVDVGPGTWVPDSFYETEYEVMKSRAVARAAGEKIGIAHDLKRNGLAGVTDPAEREQKEAAIDPADLTLGHYTIEPDKKSSVVRLAVVDGDPEFTASLANAVAEAYIEQNLDKRVSGTRDAGTWLAAQHTDLKKKLETSEDALYQFMEDNDVLNASLETQLDEVKQRLGSFNGALATTEADEIKNQLDAKALAEVHDNPAVADTLREVQQGQLINELKSRLAIVKAQRLDLTSRYQDDHPKVKAVNDQIAVLEKDLQKEIDAKLAVMERTQAQVADTEAGLKKALLTERQREARLNKLTLEYARLKREVDTNAKLYDMVTSRMKEADITSALPFNNVRILDRARAPGAPFKPNLMDNLVVALTAGLILGLLLAVLLDLVDNTLKSQEDIERTLEVPFLGLLPIIEAGGKRHKNRADQIAATKERDLYVMNHPKAAASECARFIRTNLLFMSPDRPLKTIVVTSPGPAEGKTTTAVSVACAMAQTGNRTLIVDTDMRRPRLHRIFDIESDVGLSAAIVGEAPLSSVIFKTKVPGLDVIPCGAPPPNPSELFHAERFSELLADLASRYDHVIFDAPPVGPVADPAVLGTQCDGVLLVVKCEKTTKEVAKQAVRVLSDAKARVLGVVLNDVDITGKRYSAAYYSYYSRYRGYYGGDKKEKAA